MSQIIISMAKRTEMKLTLKTNMRVQLQRDASFEHFSKQLLDIGNGKMAMDEIYTMYHIANKLL